MDEDRPEDPSHASDSGRPRRAPPTIDLEASEVSGQTQGAGSDSQTRRSFAWPFSWSFPRAFSFSRTSVSAISVMLAAAVTGAIAATMVIAVAWVMGWLGETAQPLANAQTNASAIDALVARVADLETRLAKPAAATNDPALAAKLEGLEKSLASLRGEFAGSRAQSEKLAADLNAVKSAPREAVSSPDLAAISDRLDKLESASRAASAVAPRDNKPADDLALRRVVAASMLDVSVRQGEPFVAALAAARALAPDPDALKPLNGFAASGVPNPAGLSRELLTLSLIHI